MMMITMILIVVISLTMLIIIILMLRIMIIIMRMTMIIMMMVDMIMMIIFHDYDDDEVDIPIFRYCIFKQLLYNLFQLTGFMNEWAMKPFVLLCRLQRQSC